MWGGKNWQKTSRRANTAITKPWLPPPHDVSSSYNATHWWHSLYQVKTMNCNPDYRRENYSSKTLKSQLKAFSKSILLDTKKSYCICNIPLLFPLNCMYLQNQGKQGCFYKLKMWRYDAWCTKLQQMVQTWICHPGANLSSLLLSLQTH